MAPPRAAVVESGRDGVGAGGRCDGDGPCGDRERHGHRDEHADDHEDRGEARAFRHRGESFAGEVRGGWSAAGGAPAAAILGAAYASGEGRSPLVHRTVTGVSPNGGSRPGAGWETRRGPVRIPTDWGCAGHLSFTFPSPRLHGRPAPYA
ncbi:hypothetical protein N136_04837 [Leifsonia aquatica ATCC 14665]|uniref:Uncharacterized protein n=1 Tax=Leifsonia aquatica ATCC 14665 TaxID=1358026 RepID=U2S7T9_LEIAQ|nr:hypothetical protein N136_04837 [Leifsonia aquatica ATCC 14665]